MNPPLGIPIINVHKLTHMMSTNGPKKVHIAGLEGSALIQQLLIAVIE